MRFFYNNDFLVNTKLTISVLLEPPQPVFINNMIDTAADLTPWNNDLFLRLCI